MKKFFYTIIIISIIIITIFITILNSTNIFNSIVNNFTAKYNITIGDISGNFINSINISGVKYKNRDISSNLKIRWNIISSFTNNIISITDIKIDNFDINNTLSLIDSLEDNNSKEKSSNNFNIYINHLDMGINSYKEDDINIKSNFKVELNRLILSGNNLKLNNLKINIPKLNYSKNIINQTKLNINELLIDIKSNKIYSLFMDFKSSINNNNIASNIECHQDICKIFNLIDSPFSKNMILTTQVDIRDKIKYSGALIVEDLHIIPENYRDIFKSFTIDFRGDLNYINTDISSKSINANIITQDFKRFNGYLKLDNLPNIPKEQIDYVKNLKIDFSSNLDSFDANISSNNIKSSITSKDFENFKIKIIEPKVININLTKKSKKIDIDINSKYIKSKIVGNLEKNLHINLNGKSLGEFDKTLKDIKSLKIDIDTDFKNYTINSYNILYNKYKIFSNKKSLINRENNIINIKEFWINDELLLVGDYNNSSKIGLIKLKSDRLKLKVPKYINTQVAIDSNISINNSKIAIDGGVILNGGDISYTINNKPSFVLDEDIIFIKNRKKSTNKFINNLSIELNILTNKALKYRKKDINIKTKIYTHLSKKFDKDFKLFGQVSLEKGSRYIFRNKRLFISNSSIHFTGELDKPILDIKALYKNSDYRIRILVSGSHLNPSINFISTPYLSKEGILSILLLDSSGLANSSNRTEDLQYLLGGAVAKSLLSNIGLKVEHFVISSGSLEVGKRIGDKIMVIYQKDKVSSVKVVYEHTKDIELDFMIKKESSSADIFYKGSY